MRRRRPSPPRPDTLEQSIIELGGGAMYYSDPGATLTLQQGLSEYYGARDDLFTGRGASKQAREFFRCHDAAHVVFGCGTNLPQEANVKVWSLFGTTAGLGLLRDYRLPEAQEIYHTLRWNDIARTSAFSLIYVPIVLKRCLQMHRRWPWTRFHAYLSEPLVEIRQEFGIRVLEVRSRAFQAAA